MTTLYKLNQLHAIVRFGGKVKIAYFRGNTIEFLNEEDFVRMYKNKRLDRDAASLGERWLVWKHRRECLGGVVFAPGKKTPSDTINLWRGFGVKPEQGDVQIFLDFVREVICSGDDVLFAYVLAWMADAVQHPGERPGVALVLSGAQGTGKSFFAETFGSLLGSHFMVVCDPKHLVGGFNKHLMDKCVIFADEGAYGSRAAAAKLKNLITSDSIVIEPKGVDAFSAPNNIRIILAGNDHCLVRTDHDDRRHLVLELSRCHQQDHAYFAQLAAWREAGGRAALLHYLLHHDTSAVNLRQVPRTKRLLEQKLRGFSPVVAWYLDKLTEGELERGEAWDDVHDVGHLRLDFTDYAGWTRGRSTETQFGLELGRMVPGLKRLRRKNVLHYQLPPLAECRAAFESWIGHDIEWPTEEN